MWIWMNGKTLPEEKAHISPFDSAYLYGVGIFETLRSIKGQVLLFESHFRRMKSNADHLKLKIPLTSKALKKAIQTTLSRNKLTESTIRVILSRNESTSSPQVTILTRPFHPYAKTNYLRGGYLIFAKSVLADSTPVARIKTTSYLTKMLARQEAEKKKAVESLLVTEKGFVTEGASSNLFIVKKEKLVTPPLTGGLLPGTRRSFVLSLAKKLRIPFLEKHLTVRDVKEADEIFVTSTLKDILPIRTIDGKKIKMPCPGPITRRLMEEYKNRILDQ